MGFGQVWEPAPGNGKGCSIWSLPVMPYVSYFLMNCGMWPLCKVTSLDLAPQALKGLDVLQSDLFYLVEDSSYGCVSVLDL